MSAEKEVGSCCYYSSSHLFLSPGFWWETHLCQTPCEAFLAGGLEARPINAFLCPSVGTTGSTSALAMDLYSNLEHFSPELSFKTTLAMVQNSAQRTSELCVRSPKLHVAYRRLQQGYSQTEPLLCFQNYEEPLWVSPQEQYSWMFTVVHPTQGIGRQYCIFDGHCMHCHVMLNALPQLHALSSCVCAIVMRWMLRPSPRNPLLDHFASSKFIGRREKTFPLWSDPHTTQQC